MPCATCVGNGVGTGWRPSSGLRPSTGSIWPHLWVVAPFCSCLPWRATSRSQVKPFATSLPIPPMSWGSSQLSWCSLVCAVVPMAAQLRWKKQRFDTCCCHPSNTLQFFATPLFNDYEHFRCHSFLAVVQVLRLHHPLGLVHLLLR